MDNHPSFSGSHILQASPGAMHRLRDSSSSDIQIAAETELSRERARFSLEASSCSSSSVRALCGPHPAKISLVCVLVISVWLMAVFVMHLDKKLSLTTEALEDTKEKIQTIQDAVEGDRCGRLLFTGLPWSRLSIRYSKAKKMAASLFQHFLPENWSNNMGTYVRSFGSGGFLRNCSF